MTITAKVICDSIANGIRLTSIQSKAPMFLDAEFEKHRRLSNISSNSSSNRAIPLMKMLDQGYYLPEDVRLNRPGMQGDLLLDEHSKEEFWHDLKELYGYTANILKKWDKVHKQHLNRYLAGFYWQDKICTGVEWENFWDLRVHPDADPAMYDVAKKMKDAMDNSDPNELKAGEWHMPYIQDGDYTKVMNYTGVIADYDTLIKLSVARCARVSYLNHDNTNPKIEKDLGLHDSLVVKKPKHSSPAEHQATPMDIDGIDIGTLSEWIIGDRELPRGITHVDRSLNLWSGNFRGFVQYRQLIQNQ